MQPLSGIKVLDLSRLLPGPYATMVLADMGAQVDKLEDLGGGDYIRNIPPMNGDQGIMFLALNRNKRSACLDLKKPAAQKAFLQMIERYDVVFDQFRPGVMDRLGLSYAKLREKNPRLIICALTGYGQDGPLAQRAGHDINYLSRAGVLGLQGPVGQAPTLPGFQLADIGGGIWCVTAILAALLERARTGQGAVLDISMIEASMGFAIGGIGLMLGGQAPKRGDEGLTGGIAVYQTYMSKDDKPISLGALEPKFWMAFCAGAGIEPDMTAIMPGPHQAAAKEKVAAIFRTKTRAEWEDFAKKHDCCLEPVLEPEELESDPHLTARGVFFQMPSPWGTLKQLRTPLTPKDRAHAPPPRQGEHTDAILRECGIDEQTIATLKAEGAAR
jgi:crotonobetainyl-CoA:carnitine CoA-transferase CaiB-like acyl-CoA transferase